MAAPIEEEIVAPTEADWNNMQMVGETLGMIATLCFTVQYAPQAWKNYKRKSCQGFSSTGIIIKLVGAAFLMCNAYILGETLSVTLYGVFNVFEHSIFMIQFAVYTNDYKFMIWLLFPIIPLILGTSLPSTIPLTNGIKPGAQVMSHIPQLILCWNMKTTNGVSLDTQHLNMVGGVCGLIMCILITPKSNMTYFLYINSMFQALSLYTLAIKFDKYKFCFGEKQTPKDHLSTFKGSDIDADNDLENEPFIKIDNDFQTHNNPRAVYSENDHHGGTILKDRDHSHHENDNTTQSNDLVVV